MFGGTIERVKVSVGNGELGVLVGMTASTEVDEFDGVADVTDSVIVAEDEMVTVSSEVEGLCVTAGELDVELMAADAGELDSVVEIVTLSVEVAGMIEDETGELGELTAAELVISISSVQVVSYVTDEVAVALLGFEDGVTPVLSGTDETGETGLDETSGVEELHGM